MNKHQASAYNLETHVNESRHNRKDPRCAYLNIAQLSHMFSVIADDPKAEMDYYVHAEDRKRGGVFVSHLASRMDALHEYQLRNAMFAYIEAL
jgi:hypothetical protein